MAKYHPLVHRYHHAAENIAQYSYEARRSLLKESGEIFLFVHSRVKFELGKSAGGLGVDAVRSLAAAKAEEVERCSDEEIADLFLCFAAFVALGYEAGVFDMPALGERRSTTH